MDAGLKAPSSNHQRRWDLVTLTDKSTILELAKFIRPYTCRIQEPKTPQQEMFKIAYPRQSSMVEESACVILPYFKQKYAFDNAQNDYGLMDYGGSMGAGGKLTAGYYLPALVILGYPSKDALLPSQVKATVANKVHWNKW